MNMQKEKKENKVDKQLTNFTITSFLDGPLLGRYLCFKMCGAINCVNYCNFLTVFSFVSIACNKYTNQ